MSIFSLFSDIKSKIFGSDKQNNIKNTDSIDSEYTDLEEGLYKRQPDLKNSYNIIYNNIIYNNIIYNNIIYNSKYKMIEHYISIMNISNYFSRQINEIEELRLPQTVYDVIEINNEYVRQYYELVIINDKRL